MASSETVAQCVAILGEAYGRRITDTTFRAYELALADADDKSVTAAVTALLRSSRFMPTPAELLERCGVGATGGEDAALVAWEAVSRAVVEQGAYRHVDFSDRVTNAVVRSLGGWPQLCERPEREFDTHTRREFLKTYAAFCRTGVSDEAAAPLKGLAESGPVRTVSGGSLEYAPEVRMIEVGVGEVAKRLPKPAAKQRPNGTPRIAFKDASE